MSVRNCVVERVRLRECVHAFPSLLKNKEENTWSHGGQLTVQTSKFDRVLEQIRTSLRPNALNNCGKLIVRAQAQQIKTIGNGAMHKMHPHGTNCHIHWATGLALCHGTGFYKTHGKQKNITAPNIAHRLLQKKISHSCR